MVVMKTDANTHPLTCSSNPVAARRSARHVGMVRPMAQGPCLDADEVEPRLTVPGQYWRWQPHPIFCRFRLLCTSSTALAKILYPRAHVVLGPGITWQEGVDPGRRADNERMIPDNYLTWLDFRIFCILYRCIYVVV